MKALSLDLQVAHGSWAFKAGSYVIKALLAVKI